MVGGREKPKLMLYSTLVEIEVEVGVELGKIYIHFTSETYHRKFEVNISVMII